jgi:LacI family fructose operon transcriptional repressor
MIMTTIRDVASHAGVSVATVSRVLSNQLNVRPDTRELVLKAIDELGYRPNRIAGSLRRQKTNVIAIIVSDIRNPFFTAITRAIEDVANQKQMSVFICNTDENPDKERRYLDTLLDEHVAGIIISPTPSPKNHFQAILEHDTALVLIDRRIEGADADHVLSDNMTSAEVLTDHLIAQGYRRIAAAIGLEKSTTGCERMLGYERSMRNHGLKPQGAFIKPSQSDGEAIVRQWLDSDSPPDAIFTGNSLITMGAFTAIRSSGLRIPDDLGLAGFDETIWTPHVASGITVISQPTHELGRTAAELLFQRIEEPNRPTKEVILKGTLIIRASTGRKHSG